MTRSPTLSFHLFLILLLTSVLLYALTTAGRAEPPLKSSLQALKGVATISVGVPGIVADIDSEHLDANTIRLEVLNRLRKDRITIIDIAKSDIDLEVAVTISKDVDGQGYIYDAALKVYDLVSDPVQHDRTWTAWTWYKFVYGHIDQLPEIFGRVNVVVDQFITDYNTANGRSSTTPSSSQPPPIEPKQTHAQRLR